MRQENDDFKPVRPLTVERVYEGFKDFLGIFRKRVEPRKQVDFAAGVYAQMQLNNPHLLFAGGASFIVTNIYAQADSQFPRLMRPFAYPELVTGTMAVFEEITPAFTCLAIAKRQKWNKFDVVNKIIEREEGSIEEYRKAGLEYAIIKKPKIHAQMTLMNEQYNTLQPLLYSAWYQKIGYSFLSAAGIIKQQVVFSANPTKESGTLTVVPRLFSGPSYNFKSPEQRWIFGTKVMETYYDLCKHEPDYVVDELEKIRNRAKEIDPVLWNTYIEPVLPTRSREEVVKDFRKKFSDKV